MSGIFCDNIKGFVLLLTHAQFVLNSILLYPALVLLIYSEKAPLASVNGMYMHHKNLMAC